MRALKALLTTLSLLSAPVICATELDAFVDQLVNDHQFDADQVRSTLALAQKDQAVLDAISRPWEAKPWHQYYPIFLTDKRVNKGVAFWKENADTLARAEQQTGVPAEMIVAIIGVETFYGTYKGKYPVLDALYTLGFHYPPRSKFFRSELAQFFVLAREEKLDMQSIKGSYAGAMGWGQFISSSYRHYAVDFDGDGIRDLLSNPVDAIGSVANYFRQHGWRRGEAVAYELGAHSDALEKLVTDDLKPDLTWSEVKSLPAVAQKQISLIDDATVNILAFEQPEHKDYWLGLDNFYVITRYNHSPLYAMAVYQLSEQIKAAYHSS